jgi:hypothetical protein
MSLDVLIWIINASLWTEFISESEVTHIGVTSLKQAVLWCSEVNEKQEFLRRTYDPDFFQYSSLQTDAEGTCK